MPTYDYKCNDCGVDFEHFQSMNSPVLDECTECGGKLTRLIGAGSGPIFKGTGFYETDYKNKGKSSAKKSSGSKTSKSTTKKSA